MEEDAAFLELDAIIAELTAGFPAPRLDPNYEFVDDSVSPERLDHLLANGWRHFGIHFFRYEHAMFAGKLQCVVPLRIDLSRFSFSKSQRRTLNRNRDLTVEIHPITITREAEELFDRHKLRFAENHPRSIYDYLSDVSPASVPCSANELCVYLDERLIAASYFDLGADSISSIYGMFEPLVTHRRLGIFTMLKEIEFAIETGRSYYYLGYCYDGESFYDYKKRFRATEAFDWTNGWLRRDDLSDPL